jgi:hypothetical protein
VLRPLALFAASRLAIAVALAAGAVLSPDYRFGDLFLRWDGAWYVEAARSGYPHTLPVGPHGGRGQSTVAFFPLFPLVIRSLARVTGMPLEASALVVTLGFGALATILVWLLVRRVAGSEVADRATALFCFFPGSFVLSMAYSEPLMLALAAGCLLALLSERWVIAGVAAGLATATRPNAIALVACCLWEGTRRVRRGEWRALAAPVLAPTGMLAFFGFLWVRTGRADAWFRTQGDAWEQKFDYGRRTLRDVGRMLQHPLADINVLIAVVCVVFLVVTGALLLRAQLPSVLLVYTAVIVFLAYTSEVTGSRPRFLLVAFPLLIPIAQKSRGVAFSVVLGSSAVLLAALAMLSTGGLAATP